MAGREKRLFIELMAVKMDEEVFPVASFLPLTAKITHSSEPCVFLCRDWGTVFFTFPVLLYSAPLLGSSLTSKALVEDYYLLCCDSL
jgi:hypothetical protein